MGVISVWGNELLGGKGYRTTKHFYCVLLILREKFVLADAVRYFNLLL